MFNKRQIYVFYGNILIKTKKKILCEAFLTCKKIGKNYSFYYQHMAGTDSENAKTKKKSQMKE